uniref:ethanolamine kinase n=1 Tax=Tetraselmis chuii TaxID=63592 RepID=A0A7S1X512_9CHLO
MSENMQPELPTAEVELGVEAPVEEAKTICIQLLPSWRALCKDDLDVTTISGGITNVMVKVTPESGKCLDPVVVRIFGRDTEKIIDREEELRKLLQLNQHGFGAKVLAVFSNGRIEEFLKGRIVALSELQLPEVQSKIAVRMAEFHSLLSVFGTEECSFWNTIASWIKQAEQLKLDDPEKQASLEQINFEQYQADINSVKATLLSLNSPVVLSHNDLLHANIMMLEDGSLQLIDFEYGGTNYRGFDLGNHFNEFAGLDCDYTRYPPRSIQENYARAYLLGSGAAESPTDDQVRRLVVEANVSSLASHLFWGLWALIQARYSSIDFDYVEYAKMRYAEFKRRREEFLGMAVGI